MRYKEFYKIDNKIHAKQFTNGNYDSVKDVVFKKGVK